MSFSLSLWTSSLLSNHKSTEGPGESLCLSSFLRDTPSFMSFKIFFLYTWLSRSMWFSCQILGNFKTFLLLFTCNLFPLWSSNVNPLYLLRLILWPRICFTLLDVPYSFEKNNYSAIFKGSSLSKSITSSW